MLVRLAAVALLLPLLLPGAAATAAAATPAYTPHVHDAFTFAETISIIGGFGNYSGYTETDTVTGTVTVTGVNVSGPGVEQASFFYAGNDTSSSESGVLFPWNESGSFTFSAATLEYVAGTDDQPNATGSEVWFYLNSSTAVGTPVAPLFYPMTVESRTTSYPLDTAAGSDVAAIYVEGDGTTTRNDDYGAFNVTYVWRMYFDPTTGFILGYDWTEFDSNGQGDGFVYTDVLAVTKTTYALTPASAPPTYGVTFTETGLPSGTSWTVAFNGVLGTSTTSTVGFSGAPNGTYLYSVHLAGYSADPSAGFLAVSGGAAGTTVTFTAASSSSPGADALLVDLLVLAIVVVVVVVLVVALSRAARRRSRLPRHSAGGQVQYGPPPTGPAPPPISLRPADQPQIQQVVVQEVVKVNCRYCGSLIDSTAEKCPFCGATRS